MVDEKGIFKIICITQRFICHNVCGQQKIFLWWGYPLKSNTKYRSHTLIELYFVERWMFKSSRIYERLSAFGPPHPPTHTPWSSRTALCLPMFHLQYLSDIVVNITQVCFVFGLRRKPHERYAGTCQGIRKPPTSRWFRLTTWTQMFDAWLR